MGDTRVPKWYAATGLHSENHRVYDAFRELLHHLPMSYTELAARIGVSQPAVSRWASDVSHPSRDEMAASYAAVASHLEEIQEYLLRFGEVLRLIEEALDLYELEAPAGSDGDAEERRVTRREVTHRLREMLGLSTDQASL